MREEKLFRAIGDVGEDLIARADEPVQKKKPVRWAGIAALAACCLIAVGLARLVTMGMGKTAFTRGLVLALGGGDVVSSPTFALVNEYDARLTVQHFDMYRVSGWDDLYSTGFFDYLDTDNVLVIEWSENIDGALPENTIYVHMEKGETETERIITIEGIDL